MAKTYRLIVGSRGWKHAGWSGGFYPDDLPEEWRLSYYANEFNGVLVPESVWRTADAGQITGWCGDVGDGFLFFLEPTTASVSERASHYYRDLFGSHWGGMLDTNSVAIAAEEGWNLRAVRERMQSLFRHSPAETIPGFFVCGNPPDIDRLREVRLLADIL